ncbi:MAG: alpha/beta hydrolase [Quisquiliibacterium sp.]
MTQPKYSEEFCNREYNNRARVPGNELMHEARVATAQAVRRSARCVLDLPYGSSQNERLDLFPANTPGGPLLVFIHGGFWRSRSKSDYSWLAPAFQARGISVALIDYDLAPAVRIETIVLQTLRAIEWLWRAAERHHYDPSRIFVAGHSAGGHLTAMCLSALWPLWDPDLPADLVKGGVAISGIYDLEPLLYASFVNVDLKLDATSAFRLSPAWMPAVRGARLITCVGGDETSEFRRQNALLARRWRAVLDADVPAPGRNHFTVLDALADPSHALFQRTVALCKG